MNRDSEIIRLLRFPLALLVVLLHAEPAIDGWSPQSMSSEYMGANIAGVVMYSLSHILAQIAVPAFFLISGYLFFLKLESWDMAVWKRKLVSRFSSIVIPYIICVGVFSLKHIVYHAFNGDESYVHGGLANLFWSSEHWRAGQSNIFGQAILMTGPAAYHLWFLRDLIVAVLLTPAFYVMLAMKDGHHRRWSAMWLGVLCVLYLTRVQIPIPGLSCSTFFFFGLGAYLSLNRMGLYGAFYKYRRISALLFIVLYFCLVPLDGNRSQTGTYIMPIEDLLGVICVINLAAFLTSTRFSFDFLRRYEKVSFFMFIIHPFFLAIVWRLLTMGMTRLFGVENITGIEFVNSHPLTILTLFFSKIAVAAVLSVLAYHAIARVSPRLSKLICGR